MADTNPYSSPSCDSPPIGPSRASRIRRRLFGLFLFLASCLLFLLRDWRPITATILAPTLGLYGLAGALYPLAIPDPKREFGIMQAWIDFTRKEAGVGFFAMGVGLLCGLILLFL